MEARKIIITGGATRIGAAIAKQLSGTFSPEELAQKIDSSILDNYKLWDTNLYAHEFLKGDVDDNKYPVATKYFNDLRATMTNEDLKYIMIQYANPVLAIKENNNER